MPVTQPDYPDFVPAGVPISISKVLQSPFGTSALPFTSPTYDCSRFNSINLWAQVLGSVPTKIVQLTVTWIAAGLPVAVDYYSILNGAGLTFLQGNTVLRLPCKGDSFNLTFSTDAGGASIQFSVTATTRTPPAPSITTDVSQDPLMPGWMLSQSVAAGATVITNIGPFSSGFWVILSSAGTVGMNIFAWVLHAGVWSQALLDQMSVSATSTSAAKPIYVAGRAIQLSTKNTSAGALLVSLSVMGLG